MLRSALIKLLCLCLLPLSAMAEGVPLTDLKGNPRSIGEFVGKGQWVVVMFWEYSCGICNAEAPELDAFHRKHKDGKARVLGLSVNGPAYARDFVREHELTFDNLLIKDEDAASFFYESTGDYLPGVPGFLVYSPDGEVRTYQTGVLDLGMLERFIARYEAMVATEN